MARATPDAPNMGLTSWAGLSIQKADVTVAKNDLGAEEIEALKRIVPAYLDFAELQAMNRRPMTMGAWIVKLDDFLRLADRDVLTHAGRITAEAARDHAEAAFAAWRATQRALPEPVDAEFEKALRETLEIQRRRPGRPNRNAKE